MQVPAVGPPHRGGKGEDSARGRGRGTEDKGEEGGSDGGRLLAAASCGGCLCREGLGMEALTMAGFKEGRQPGCLHGVVSW